MAVNEEQERRRRATAEALLEMVASHVNAERDVLRRYEALVSDQKLNADIRFLLSMILADELRHHSYLQALTAGLKSEIEGRPERAALPTVSWRIDEETRQALLKDTDELRALEDGDLRELRRLRKEFRPYSSATLWDLIVSWMQRDTRKHLDVLDFLRRHLKRVA